MTAPTTEYAVPLPASLDAWQADRARLRQCVRDLLGEMPPLFTPALDVHAEEQRDGYRLQRFTFDNAADDIIYGYLMIPDRLRAPAPAVLYLHSHGSKYARGKEELFADSPTGHSPVPALMALGCIVLAIDCYAFGERSSRGPNGPADAGRENEHAWFKKHLWEGRTLWGMIVRDDLLALNALLAHPLVDPSRVAATGMSLGGSRTTWLAALDERIAAAVPVAQMTRYREFAARGDFTRHSVYYYVPGALRSGIDMEVLTALAAPRTQRILIGDSDPLSPVEGVHIIDAFTRHIYDLYGARDRYEATLYAGVDHAYTPSMFAALLDVLRAL